MTLKYCKYFYCRTLREKELAMSMIEAIGTDLKMSIDDLVNEIKKIKKDVRKIKWKLDLINPDEEDDLD